MQEYCFKTRTNRHFVLLKNGIEVGSLELPFWNLGKPQFTIGGQAHQYLVSGFWRTRGSLLLQGSEVLSFTKSFMGTTRTLVCNDTKATKLLAEYKGLFRRRATLTDASTGDLVHTITKHFNWRKMAYDFNVVFQSNPNLTHGLVPALLLLHLHFMLVDLRRARNAAH
jgi:hypothetical protein